MSGLFLGTFNFLFYYTTGLGCMAQKRFVSLNLLKCCSNESYRNENRG